MSPRTRAWLVVAITAVATVALQAVAFADDCGSLTDCYATARSALAAAAGLAAFLGAAVSMGLDFIPGVGTAKGIYEAFTGEDMITGEKLAWWERTLGILPFAGAIIGGAAAGVRAVRRGADALDTVSDTARAADRARDTAGAAGTATRGADRGADAARGADRAADTADTASDTRRVATKDEVPDVTKAPEGAEIPRERFNELGYRPQDIDAIQDVARRYDVDIDVRPTNPDAIRHLDNGAHPKSVDIKSKTIQDADLHLNPRLTPDDVGTVGYFDPVPPKRPSGMSDADWSRVQDRYQQRRSEFVDQADKMQSNAAHGKATVDDRGVVRHPGDGKPYTGDIDVFEVRSRDPNKPLTYEQRVEVTDALQRETGAVQHGAHRDWRYPETDTVSKGIDDKIRGSHQPGGETLVRVSPQGNPTAAYYHPP